MTATNCRRVLDAIRRKPRTCDEVEVATGLAHQVVSARMRDLAKRGVIIRAMAVRKTRLGRLAWVWRAV